MKNNLTAILIRPRATIRCIVDTNPAHGVLLLAALTGGLQLYLRFRGLLEALGMHPFLSLTLPLLGGALLGVLLLYVFGWFYRVVGSWLGGKASTGEVRAALAWARVPILYVLIPALVVFLIAPQAMALRILLTIASAIAGVWAFVLTCKTLGEVHRFSSWMGLVTILIVNLLFVTPVAYLTVRTALMAPAYMQGQERAYQAAAMRRLREIVQAAEFYKMEQGRYPETIEKLVDENYLDEVPYRTLFKDREYERYRYRFQAVGSASPYPIEVERMRPSKDLPKVLSYDGKSERILRDGY